MFEIQVVDRAFSARIPEHLWQTVSHPKTARGACRVAARWRRRFTPQQHAWSGHVRTLRDGKPVVIEPYDFEVRTLD